MSIFTEEHDEIRTKYGSKLIADYSLRKISKDKLDKHAIKLLEEIPYFFLATSNKEGHVNVNFKGSENGPLIKVLNEKSFIFPDYIGNGIFHGLGDILSNPNVGILIIDFDKQFRFKISGKASIIDDKNELTKYLDIFKNYDTERVIKIDVEYVISNCNRRLSIVKNSILE